MIVWCDAETTGLDPVSDRLLELAVVVTDDDLYELGSFHALLRYWTDEPDRIAVIEGVDEVVLQMHNDSGLWADLETEELMSYMECQATLCRFLSLFIDAEDLDQGKNLPPLGGSTVAFDRSFLARFMPLVLQMVSHRNLDVSVLKEMAKRWEPSLADHVAEMAGGSNGAVHRAMPDILDSIEAMGLYRDALFVQDTQA